MKKKLIETKQIFCWLIYNYKCIMRFTGIMQQINFWLTNVEQKRRFWQKKISANLINTFCDLVQLHLLNYNSIFNLPQFSYTNIFSAKIPLQDKRMIKICLIWLFCEPFFVLNKNNALRTHACLHKIDQIREIFMAKTIIFPF